jgi:large subunit ribosomal protein L25
MSEVLHVKVRAEIGSNAVKRVRQAGDIPAILYGHGKGCVNLSVPAEELHTMIRHRTKMVNLEGGVSETALIREVQWDALGIEVLHLDMMRVTATEMVQVTVPVELRGEAPGTKSGGVIDHSTHEAEFECPAGAIPERLEVNINSLELGQLLKLSDLELPEGCKLLSDPDLVVVQCIEPVEVPEEAAVAEAGEPEIVGRKVDDEQQGES